MAKDAAERIERWCEFNVAFRTITRVYTKYKMRRNGTEPRKSEGERASRRHVGDVKRWKGTGRNGTEREKGKRLDKAGRRDQRRAR